MSLDVDRASPHATATGSATRAAGDPVAVRADEQEWVFDIVGMS